MTQRHEEFIDAYCYYMNIVLFAFVIGFVHAFIFDFSTLVFCCRHKQKPQNSDEVQKLKNFFERRRKHIEMLQKLQELEEMKESQVEQVARLRNALETLTLESASLQDMEQSVNQRSHYPLRRTARPNRYQILYNSEQNQWMPQEQIIEEELTNEHHLQEIEQNLELLEASARNTSTPIRPYLSSRYRHYRDGRHQTETNMVIASNPWSEEEEILIENREQERSYFRDLRQQYRRAHRQMAHMTNEEIQYQAIIREEGSDQDEPLISSDQRSAKSIEEYKEFIPACWAEILERDNQISIAIMESYGPLALLLYTRIMKLSKECEDMRELRVIAIISATQSQNRNGLEEIKFIQKILEFYNFNISLARRDAKSKARLKMLLSIIPTFRELKEVMTTFPPDDKELVVYKVVLDIMERYYVDFDGPTYKNYRKQLIPFAKFFYSKTKKLTLQKLKDHLNYFKPYYSKFLIYDGKSQYLEHYERKGLEFDNLCRGTSDQDCYM